jgi:predicted DsbA family dithiol-disulfide isomerase
VLLTHWMAMESDKIKAVAIEANEFPELSRRYRVMAVPRTVINDQAVIEGALPESMFVRRILEAIRAKPEEPPAADE